ncbi:MAG: hypothetical protein IKI69_04605 [Oscillospiraceae bacterium]|nr:hypothetical protein [Oscillospiraceae bacterium]
MRGVKLRLFLILMLFHTPADSIPQRGENIKKSLARNEGMGYNVSALRLSQAECSEFFRKTKPKRTRRSGFVLERKKEGADTQLLREARKRSAASFFSPPKTKTKPSAADSFWRGRRKERIRSFCVKRESGVQRVSSDEDPGIAQLVARVVWERVTPPAIGRNPKSPEALKTLRFWRFISSTKSPKITV